MNNKKSLYFLLLSVIVSSFSGSIAAQSTPKYELYGFIRNDFYFNSRQNVEVIDGITLYDEKRLTE